MLHKPDLTWLVHRKEACLMHSAPTAAVRLAKVYQQLHSNDLPQLRLQTFMCPPLVQELDRLPCKHTASPFQLPERLCEKKDKVGQLKLKITSVVAQLVPTVTINFRDP